MLLLLRQRLFRTTVQPVATAILQLLNLATLLRVDTAPAMMFRAIRPTGPTHRRTTAAHRPPTAAGIRLQATLDIHPQNMAMGRLLDTHILMATVLRLAMVCRLWKETMAVRAGVASGQAAA